MNFAYPGIELNFIPAMKNWTAHWAGNLPAHLGRPARKTGAVPGSNICFLFSAPGEEWTALESDVSLTRQIDQEAMPGALTRNTPPRTGRYSDLDQTAPFERSLCIGDLDQAADCDEDLRRERKFLDHDGSVANRPLARWTNSSPSQIATWVGSMAAMFCRCDLFCILHYKSHFYIRDAE